MCVCGLLILMNEGAMDDSWERGSMLFCGACVYLCEVRVYV